MRISLFKPGAEAHQTRLVESYGLAFSLNDVAAQITKQPWSPATFNDGIRNNKTLQSIELLVLDVDDGCTLEQAKECFASYAHIIATTKSHQKEKNGVACDRFRVVLQLPKPVTTDEEFKEYWFAAKALWPFIDDACKDSARFFYPCVDVVAVSHGALFSERVTKPASKPAISQQQSAVGKRGKLSSKTKDFLINGADSGNWHRSMHKATVDLKEQLYTIDEATERLQKITGHLDEHDLQLIDDVYNNRPVKYPPRNTDAIDWPVTRTSKEGVEMPDLSHPDNYKYFLTEVQRCIFSLNELDQYVYLNGKPVTDFDYIHLFLESKSAGLRCGKEFVIDVISELASANSYHPFKQVVERIAWDGTDHIAELYKTITVSDTEADYADYLKRWLIGIIAKVYRPGSQNFVLTFMGDQGIGKSRWLSKLALVPQAFGEGTVDPSNKDHLLRHVTNIIWHIPELEYTTGKRETGALKDYLTTESITVRPAYARTTRVGRSICSFCASVNSDAFLVDQTGNRRFVVFPVDRINHMHNVDMQQVFAQAKVLFEQDFQYWFNEAEIKILNQINEQYRPETEIEHLMSNVESGDHFYSAIEVLTAFGILKPYPSQVRELAAICKNKGIKKTQKGRAKKRGYLMNDLRLINVPSIRSNMDN